MEEKHIFTLFIAQPLPQNISSGQEIIIKDADLVHRITRVLRIRQNDAVVLFDGNTTVYITKCTSNKDFLTATVEKTTHVCPLQPEINLYCGLVKKDALESIAYFAAQLGVTSITPLITQKCERKELSEKEIVRLKNITIAACEQAKQFWIPKIEKITPFNMIIEKKSYALKLYCEAEGKKLIPVLQNNVSNNIALFIGPEGGFTCKEQKLMSQDNFHCCSLTPTILRSQEATIVALGIIRNFCINE